MHVPLTITDHLDRGHGFAASRVELVVSGRCARCRRADVAS